LIVLAHADVLVENPEIARLARSEIAKYLRFCETKQIELAVRVAHPAFWDSFAVRVLGGLSHLSPDGSRRRCRCCSKLSGDPWKVADTCKKENPSDLAGKPESWLVISQVTKRGASEMKRRQPAER
jgi:hypothetical protein